MRPWTGEQYAVAAGAHGGLQWGHGLAAVDGVEVDAKWHRLIELQWGHGLAAVDGVIVTWGRGARRGFNGATALRPWTELPRLILARQDIASMGPRPCGRGRFGLCGLRALPGGLQWGHGLAAVDGRL